MRSLHLQVKVVVERKEAAQPPGDRPTAAQQRMNVREQQPRYDHSDGRWFRWNQPVKPFLLTTLSKGIVKQAALLRLTTC